jgi:hypothetical protein
VPNVVKVGDKNRFFFCFPYVFLPVMALYCGPLRTFLSFNIMMHSSPARSRKK